MSLARFFDRRVNQQTIEKSLKFLLFDRFKDFHYHYPHPQSSRTDNS